MAKPKTTITVPVGRPLVKVLDVCYAAGQTPLLAGATGVGKSTQLEEYARSKELQFRVFDLSLMEPSDLVGLPKLDGNVTRFQPPASLPTTKDGKGLLVFEEINRAPQYMRAPCLQMLTARCLNDYRFPSTWKMAAAINPAEDGYDADELDPALESRFVRINVVASPDEWVAWAKEHKVDSRVIEYVLSDTQVFDSPASNPRAWTAVARLYEEAEKLGTARGLLRAVIAGCVGAERAASFLKFAKERIKPLDAMTVLKDYRKMRQSLQAWVTEGKLDLVQGTVLNVKKFLQSKTEYATARKSVVRWRNLTRLLTDLPGDLREDAAEWFRERKYDVPTVVGGDQ
ncbi:MAG: AAA family ATPase [Planctomycetes bacterium]|nr:AAA family ATPase [Planctomycetota bacterium]